MITVTIYPAGGLITRKQWRWTARADNGKVIATGGSEKYYNKGDLFATLHLLFGLPVRDGDSPVPVRVRDLSDGTVTELR